MSCFAAVPVLVLLLTGCGSYSFEQKELTEAIGVSKSVIDKLEIQPDDNGDTGSELLEQAKNMGGGFDFYTYWFENGNGYDIVGINFASGKVCTASLASFETEKSEYTVLGIRTGDSREKAVSAAEAYFGEKGTALSDDVGMWALTSKTSDMITYGNSGHKKGTLFIYIDVESDSVYKIEYSKF
ncbi:MAG: hypothetical protein IJZ72_04500 [Oscillospiraceae bacterium]|nr:hypothetical protein [Oscillospiraceae bacterium]